MKKFKKASKAITVLLLSVIMMCTLTTTVFAITESEVQAKIDASSKEAVTGNIFIWFLCALSFLKVSQKIDSFMSALGINVGHTGGNMLAEAMIAARGIGEGRKLFGGGGGGGFSGFGSRGARGASGASGTSGGDGASGGFLSGGLAGAVSRQMTRSAVKTATGQGNMSVGGAAFNASLEKGGDFANNVVSKVATGSVASIGTMTGAEAAKGLHSYLGHALPTSSIGDDTDGSAGGDPSASASIPYSNVEIGGGRITGTEINETNPGGIQFGMYNTDQYLAPEGEHSVVETVDGSKWYKQYAVDMVEKTPYMAPDGGITYTESIEKKMPRIPQRKDRV